MTGLDEERGWAKVFASDANDGAVEGFHRVLGPVHVFLHQCPARSRHAPLVDGVAQQVRRGGLDLGEIAAQPDTHRTGTGGRLQHDGPPELLGCLPGRIDGADTARARRGDAGGGQGRPLRLLVPAPLDGVRVRPRKTELAGHGGGGPCEVLRAGGHASEALDREPAACLVHVVQASGVHHQHVDVVLRKIRVAAGIAGQYHGT